MEEEYNMHLQNQTWEIVKLPPGKKAIGSGWVYRVKRNADGSIERYKGRLVAKGFSQRPGLDYTEVFAPTARQASIRLILALAAIEDLHLHSIDISHAFINGKLEEEVYMEQPQGFQEHGPELRVLDLLGGGGHRKRGMYESFLGMMSCHPSHHLSYLVQFQ
jgi:hypothetical protein